MGCKATGDSREFVMSFGVRSALAVACAAALVAVPFGAPADALATESVSAGASTKSSAAAATSSKSSSQVKTYPQSVAMAKVALNEPSGIPAGGQSNKYNQENGQAWCAYFVMWCARAAGADASVVPDMPACRDMMAFYQKQGRFGSLAVTPKAGDLVFFAYTPGGVANHVGIVLKATDTTLTVREGNTDGGRIATHTYDRTRTDGCVSPSLYILGYARPDYAKTVRMVAGDDTFGSSSNTDLGAAGSVASGFAADAKVTYNQVSEAYHEVCCQTEVDGSYSAVATQLHDYVWLNDELVCKECGAAFANHTKGEYLVPDDLQVEDGAATPADDAASSDATADVAENTASADATFTIPTGTAVRVTKVQVSDEGQYLGRVSFRGHELWLALSDLQRNGTAGIHDFADGACQDCGIHEACTNPGTYRVASEATLYANDGSGKTAELSEGAELTIVQVFVGPDTSYWGKTDDNRLVLMSQLSAVVDASQAAGQLASPSTDARSQTAASQSATSVTNTSEEAVGAND